ncbi:MAG: DUF4173 domain-containing protein [Salinivirgaceae bacterium]|nr:DUF4173 domain-containing protein [Salinivirgaceae bacterium]
MKNKPLLLVFLHALLFTFLFYKQTIGINLLIFELLSIGSLLLILKIKLTDIPAIVVLFGTIITAIFTVINFSVIVIFINICSYLLLTGVMVYPKAKSLISSAFLSIVNFFLSAGAFYQSIGDAKGGNRFFRILLNILKIGIIPLIIFIVFVVIYNASNPIFSKGLTKFTEWTSIYFGDFFTQINFALFGVFILGLFISIITFFQVKSSFVIDYDTNSKDYIERKRKKSDYSRPKTTALKAELKSAVLLLVMLNVLLLAINIIDIYWVWFNFEWEGEYLKQFVHEGTYLLILSILISIGIVLFYFRGNLNFYKKNVFLKKLSYAWLAQNAVLTLSVAIRNFWYIKYFALAYKRIGVLFFLLLTLYGIYTVYLKVKDKKSAFYLLRSNKLAAYCILIIMALFNWDIIIAKYNFNHYKQSFIHYNFLSNLSNKALPYLDKTDAELEDIDNIQHELFPFEENYMSSQQYKSMIESKKEGFYEKWSQKSWKSWNLSEAIAYKKLETKNK